MRASAPNSRTAYRVALLGAGVIAGPHATALRTLPDVEIVSICDLDDKRADAISRQACIPNKFLDLPTMLDRISPDVVHVLLPPSHHAAAVEECLTAGSHVFVEKPFCTSTEECARVSAVAERVGRWIGVDHNFTYMPACLRLIDEIRAFRLGAIQNVRVVQSIVSSHLEVGPHTHWMFGAPERLMLEIGPHPISMICRLLGKVRAASSSLSGKIELTNRVPFYRTWQSSLVCERGTGQFLLSLQGEGYPVTSIHVIGEDGEAFVDIGRNTFRMSEKTPFARVDPFADGALNAGRILHQSVQNFAHFSLGSIGLRSVYLLQEMSITTSVRAFYDALRRGKNPPVGAAEGAATVAGCELVIESASQFLSQSGGRDAVRR